MKVHSGKSKAVSLTRSRVKDTLNYFSGDQRILDASSCKTYDSVWENMAQRGKTASICALFETHTGERVLKATGDRYKVPGYLSRDHHDRKIRTRKIRKNVGKHCFENRTIKLWNELSAETLGTFRCRSHIFIREEK